MPAQQNTSTKKGKKSTVKTEPAKTMTPEKKVVPFLEKSEAKYYVSRGYWFTDANIRKHIKELIYTKEVIDVLECLKNDKQLTPDQAELVNKIKTNYTDNINCEHKAAIEKYKKAHEKYVERMNLYDTYNRNAAALKKQGKTAKEIQDDIGAPVTAPKKVPVKPKKKGFSGKKFESDVQRDRHIFKEIYPFFAKTFGRAGAIIVTKLAEELVKFFTTLPGADKHAKKLSLNVITSDGALREKAREYDNEIIFVMFNMPTYKNYVKDKVVPDNVENQYINKVRHIIRAAKENTDDDSKFKSSSNEFKKFIAGIIRDFLDGIGKSLMKRYNPLETQNNAHRKIITDAELVGIMQDFFVMNHLFTVNVPNIIKEVEGAERVGELPDSDM